MTDKKVLEKEVDETFSLDDIEDMPGFVTPPSGAYVVELPKGIETKEINDANYFDVAMTIKEVLEITEDLKSDETPPKEGDMFNSIFRRDNPYGMNNFKQFVKPISERLGTTRIGDLMEGSKGMEIVIVVRRKYDKERDRHNFNIVKCAFL